jgi:hypothetical protein
MTARRTPARANAASLAIRVPQPAGESMQHSQIDVRVLAVEGDQEARQVDRLERLHRADGQGAAQASSQLGDRVARGRSGGQRVARLREQHAPGVAERDVLGAALEQLDAELALERADGCGHRRLHDAEPVGGPREAALLGHRDEVVEVAQRHLHIR